MFSSNNILTNILDPDQAQQHVKPDPVLHEVLHKANFVTTSFKMSNRSIRFDLGRKKKKYMDRISRQHGQQQHKCPKNKK